MGYKRCGHARTENGVPRAYASSWMLGELLKGSSTPKLMGDATTMVAVDRHVKLTVAPNRFLENATRGTERLRSLTG